MPESPEVQVLAEFLGEVLDGRAITAIDLEEFRVLKTRDRPASELLGARIGGVERFGKHIALRTDRAGAVISFGRAGWARWQAASADDPEDAAPVVARVGFDDRQLALTDAGEWLSLGLSVVDDPADLPAIAKLGPDPASPDFTRDDFDRAALGRRKQLKALLQEQETLSGIGNAYSDEILHVARVSPVAHAASLSPDELDRIFDSTVGVIRDAVAARRGIPIDQLKAAKVATMRVHGRTGLACPVCGDTVRDLPSSKGGAQYCPTCQTGGVPLD